MEPPSLTFMTPLQMEELQILHTTLKLLQMVEPDHMLTPPPQMEEDQLLLTPSTPQSAEDQ
jgi:hypothetical protein